MMGSGFVRGLAANLKCFQCSQTVSGLPRALRPSQWQKRPEKGGGHAGSAWSVTGFPFLPGKTV